MQTPKLIFAVVALALLGAVTAATAMGPLPPDRELRNLAIAAVSDDPAVAKGARDALRAAGPDGLAAMQFQFRPEIGKALSGQSPADDAAWRRTREAIDAIAAQRDAHASGLYWYTDLEKAKAAARESGRPILSLRLLGTLDSELSCANSRFFRTALYANSKVSAYLRDRVILHWQSVRPVPRVTIDMGDGRKIYRTITGNSIHYVLDADGRPVDAVPGLYGPAAFLRELAAAINAEQSLRGLNSRDRVDSLAAWHGERVRLTDAAWAEDMKTLGMPVVRTTATPVNRPGTGAARPTSTDTPSARVVVETAMPKAAAGERKIVREVVPPAPPAREAAKLAVGKRQAEVRIVDQVTAAPPAERPVAPASAAVAFVPPPPAKLAAEQAVGKSRVEMKIVDAVAALEAAVPAPTPAPASEPPVVAAGGMTSDLWPQVARLHAADGVLDAGSRRLMRSKFPAAAVAAAATSAKAYVEDPLVRTIANFERSVAEDTVRNEYVFHRQIHNWFAQQLSETTNVDALNKRVYAELFLTPDSDPWLGLVPADTYSALQDDGMSEACLK